ncbi:MAG: NAD(P)/FAD-dependent oxidoreductase [Gemmatimonadales bacterium]
MVVGGGPAGLSAALMLGRCRRRVLVCDTGESRNRWSHAVHGFLTRDGTSPATLLRTAREELRPYETVELRTVQVVDVTRDAHGFEVRCADGTVLRSRKLLLATGVLDDVPEIPGLEPLYGRSVHHCPYCDGWEWRDQPVAVYGRGDAGAALAVALTVWTGDLVLCTDGPASHSEESRERLVGSGIRVREERVRRLEGQDGRLERIVFEEGDVEIRRALFFATGQRQASELPARLGCRFLENGAVDTGECEATNVPGLYVCGDASREAQFVVVAAAEGAEAGMAINKALLEEGLASDNLPVRK